jgi:hypothetical protein
VSIRIFGNESRTRNTTASLRVEVLEAREVPAAFWWVGDHAPAGKSGTDAKVPENWRIADEVNGKFVDLRWSATRIPGDNVQNGEYDHVFFEGDPLEPLPEGGTRTFRDCDNFGLESGYFAAVGIGGGYDKTVTLSKGFVTVDFGLNSGKIAQPVAGTDITTTNFIWMGGELNSTTNPQTLTVAGGKATISPGTTGTLTTRDTIVFTAVNTSSGTVGTTATFNQGTVTFAGGTGMKIGASCLAKLQPSGANGVQFQASDNANGKYKIINQGEFRVMHFGGTIYVSGKSALPMLVDGGDLILEWKTGMEFNNSYTASVGGVQTPLGSVVMNAGEVSVAVASTLKVSEGMLMTSGEINAHVPAEADAGEDNRRATIDGNLTVSGGVISFDYALLGWSGYEAYLSATGNIVWSGGTFKPVINNSTLEAKSQWRCNGTFTIQGTAPLVDPFRMNPNVDPPAGRTWTVLHGGGGVTGMPQLEVNDAVDLELVTNGNPVNQLVLKRK